MKRNILFANSTTGSAPVSTFSGYVQVCSGCSTGGPHESWCSSQVAGMSDNVNWGTNPNVTITWNCPSCGLLVSSGQWHTCPQNYQQYATPQQKPHRCPVCEGKGRVTFDPERPHAPQTTVQDWPCKPCNASGIVWGF